MPRNLPVLYGYWRSGCTWRVRIALNLKDVQYKTRIVDLLKPGAQEDPEFLAVNPTKKVPALVVDGVPIVESLAIIDYLDSQYPGVSLYPKDPIKRAQAMGIALQIVSGIQPLQNKRIVEFLNKDEAGKGEKWAAYFISKGLADLEALVKRTAGKFCVGDELSVADVCLPSIIYNATAKYNVDVSVFPIISRINEELAKIEAFEKAHAENQEDYKAYLASKK